MGGRKLLVDEVKIEIDRRDDGIIWIGKVGG